ncbi:hypothetical protein BIT28_16495 [Photobacterium proteolyticum]|uniref:Uncharacterized protein n=1 Tax=Photobacterium proteolyticum TaxID=1903952 RepID=A0A1Q9G7Q0_9GAMM|nr:hypothetical protein [Photobacterium proteolyticum]OLQ70324.1 hypothetical protein BIT28_16495 [Photobacterium proteolyticum]
MSIKIQVEDAIFLKEHERYLGALTNLMLAVAASSRKTFPRGTKSLKEPKRNMRDNEAFKLFLGGRIRNILGGHFSGPETGSSGKYIEFKGEYYEIEHILYEFYRCNLVHEGELPEGIEFVPPEEIEFVPPRVAQEFENYVSIKGGHTLTLDFNWIDLLVQSVVYAKCNGETFNIKHYEMRPKNNDTPSTEKRLALKHNTSEGRIEILKHAVMNIEPEVVTSSSNSVLTIDFQQLLHAKIIDGGMLAALSSHGLSDNYGKLSSKGIDVCREIAESYYRVEV